MAKTFLQYKIYQTNKMTQTNFQIGQKVTYSVCSSIYTGKIVKIKEHSLIMIDDDSEMQLWNAGYPIGSEISFSQVII